MFVVAEKACKLNLLSSFQRNKEPGVKIIRIAWGVEWVELFKLGVTARILYQKVHAKQIFNIGHYYLIQL